MNYKELMAFYSNVVGARDLIRYETFGENNQEIGVSEISGMDEFGGDMDEGEYDNVDFNHEYMQAFSSLSEENQIENHEMTVHNCDR